METKSQKIENRFTMRDFVALATLLYAGVHLQLLLPEFNWQINVLMGLLPVLYFATIAYPTKALISKIAIWCSAGIALGCTLWTLSSAVPEGSRETLGVIGCFLWPVLCMIPAVAYCGFANKLRRAEQIVVLYWVFSILGAIIFVFFP